MRKEKLKIRYIFQKTGYNKLVLIPTVCYNRIKFFRLISFTIEFLRYEFGIRIYNIGKNYSKNIA